MYTEVQLLLQWQLLLSTASSCMGKIPDTLIAKTKAPMAMLTLLCTGMQIIVSLSRVCEVGLFLVVLISCPKSVLIFL